MSKFKILSLLLAFAMALSSCNTAVVEEESRSEAEAPSPSVEEEEEISHKEETEIKEARHDAVWWWENYIADLVYDFQDDYPSSSNIRKYNQQLDLLMLTAIRHGEAETQYVKDSNASATMSALEKYAEEAIGDGDITYFNFPFIEDEEGKINIYISSILREKEKGKSGNEHFTITDVRDIAKDETLVEVSTGERKGSFVFKDNEAGTETLKSVTWQDDEKKDIDFVSDRELYTVVLPSSNNFTEGMTIGTIGDHLVQFEADTCRLGLAEFSFFPEKDIANAERRIVIPLEKEEKAFANGSISRDGKLILTTNRFLRKIDPLNGEVIEKTAVTDNFKKQYEIYGYLWGTQYIFDEEMKHISYTTPDGIFLDDLKANKAYKICDIKPDPRILNGTAYAFRDGILYYYDGEQSFSYDRAKCVDVKKKAQIPCPFKINKAKGEENILYRHIIGDYAIGERDCYSDGNIDFIIYNLKTGAKQVFEGNTVHFIDDDDFYIVDTRNFPGAIHRNTVTRVILEEGRLAMPSLTADVTLLRIEAAGNKLIISYDGTTDGFQKGVFVMDDKKEA